MRFIAVEVAERTSVVQRELKRFGGVIEADQPNRAGQVPRGAQHSQRVCRRAEADVPNHKFPGVFADSIHQAQLLDIKRHGLGRGSDRRVHRFAIRQRMNAAGAVGELHQVVTIQSHERS